MKILKMLGENDVKNTNEEAIIEKNKINFFIKFINKVKSVVKKKQNVKGACFI